MAKNKNLKKKSEVDIFDDNLNPGFKKGLQLSSENLMKQETIDHDNIVEFLENYQDLVNPAHRESLKLISIKIPNTLLRSFKIKAQQLGVPYQTQIKTLMTKWLKDAS